MTRPTTQRTFAKDVQQLCRTIDASTDGQASVIGIDANTVKVSLRPNSGYNAHADFQLTVIRPNSLASAVFTRNSIGMLQSPVLGIKHLARPKASI